MMLSEQTQDARVAAPTRHTMLSWYVQGARSAVLAEPRWDRLRVTPATLAVLTLAGVLLQAVLERAYQVGGADFDWRALASGWLPMLLLVWACYLVRTVPPSPPAGPPAAALLALLLAQSQCISLGFGLFYLLQQRLGLQVDTEWAAWAVWLAPTVWATLAQLRMLWRAACGNGWAWTLASLTLVAGAVLLHVEPPAPLWTPRDDEGAPARRLALTQELLEAQPRLLTERLDQLQRQRPGVVDLYAISFAPYADEDVFRRESAMVAEVMAQRFDAGGRNLQLVNHVDTVHEWPWATPTNLRRAIERVASLMDRDEDVLFLHLTSHGARDGRLAAAFWPLEVDAVTPADLKAWLDAAGIRWRVVSISACYSGSWIAPLAGEGTLVMTAADAEHTSYGCGRGSELTFFGRAMYDEQLRRSTLSFEAAHAAARELIREREIAAGKSDGYSNPQIHVGPAVRQPLAALQARVAAGTVANARTATP
ncbi:C13 family peptidase [Caldimonas brevitalea]|uniref:Peptidase C13 family protein n=1 Tax=Caldimonas brevitalea TaxID=413882 RepID=A0A0G3BDI8_9BURK|nr:C13 family peptidase [Caldimonas brevitalea]AKJ27459.1 hypothetical protein AAW51_0768 [Caldimonas brevitalea]